MNKDFNLEDIIDMGYKKRESSLAAAAGQSGAKFENKTLWSYSEAIKTDHRGPQVDDQINNEQEFPNLEERIR